ncbi:expressed unknown protein [Seminavis robusta]|uniref:Transmembrane protein n=1 Tax=Seminavis robusta TaxID=568900 RepID=A0A9N8DGI3_9STRA|nr:expressed unknown protein [Seminavis robusta]|eukprot:Sro131_g062260.1 n/a (442) ;mRNA; f:47608-48933
MSTTGSTTSSTPGGGGSKTTKTKPGFTSSTNNQMKGGELRASVLSVYDLPTRDQPSHVSISACGATVTTAAPTSRHKDRNSFKFTGATSTDLVLKAKTLEQLYKSHFQVEVVYETKPWLNLFASYKMSQLNVWESTWLVLDLEQAAQATQVATTDAASSLPDSNSGLMEDLPPTIRIKVQLRGPYRPEIAALLGVAQTWFGFMDQVESSVITLGEKTPNLPANKGLLLIPAVPMATAAVVLTPILTGLCVVFLPIFVPVLAALLTVGACLTGTGLVLYGSTSGGRQHVAHMLEPAAQHMLATQSGQSLLYETGPRPSPVSVARVVLPQGMWGRLAVSLAVDAIGSASYLVPVVGEVTDVAWAPLQTCLIIAMYDTTTPHLKYLSFAEEILPFTDFVPSATIGWAAQFGPQLLLQNGKPAAAATTTNASGVPTQLMVPVKKD